MMGMVGWALVVLQAVVDLQTVAAAQCLVGMLSYFGLMQPIVEYYILNTSEAAPVQPHKEVLPYL